MRRTAQAYRAPPAVKARATRKPLRAVRRTPCASGTAVADIAAVRTGRRLRIGLRPRYPGRMPRVLHVDDNPGDREILQLALEAMGSEADIEPIGTGQGALDRLLGPAAGVRPDLVVLDLNLGPLDGLVVLRQLRAAPALATLPIVILTSSMREADRGVCLAAGANGYLTKPATWRGFSDIAAEILRLLRADAADGTAST